MVSKKKRTAIAFHEAAHAVVARALGVGVVCVAMFPTDDTNSAATITPSAAHLAGADDEARIRGREIDAKIAFAGSAANARHIGPSKRTRGTDSDAINLESAAVSIALLLAGEPVPNHQGGTQVRVSKAIRESANEIFARLTRETEALVAERWPAIERVANALMTRDLLNQQELDILIAN